MLALVWPFLIYWVVLFVLCYIVVEYGQKYLYDETTPWVGGKVALGTMVLAGLLTYSRTSYDTMLTEQLGMTVIQAIVWFGVFLFVFQFHPWHAAGIGVATMLLVAGLATMGVHSLTRTNQTAVPVQDRPSNKPLRRSVGVPATAPIQLTPPPEPAKKP